MRTNEIISTQEAENGFYPTPPGIAETLLRGIEWDMIETVLEPSAGKGNLVGEVGKRKRNFYNRYRNNRTVDVDCIEIDPYLRSILQYEYGGKREDELLESRRPLEDKQRYSYSRKEYVLTEREKAELGFLNEEIDKRAGVVLHIVHDNFLTFESRKRYHLIVMNPPFSDGDAHLLKAIEIQSRHGGLIRCILNAETIRNPYTNRRKILLEKLNELSAQITYIDGAFAQAERKTDVTVAIISIDIPEKKEESTIYERLCKAAEIADKPIDDVTDLTVVDFFEQIVSRFNVEVDAGLELIREYKAMQPYILSSLDGKESWANLTLIAGEPSRTSRGTLPDVNLFLRLTRRKYWQALFSNKEFVGKLTTNLRSKYYDELGKLQNYDFTLFNIQQLVLQMNAEMNKGIQDTIIALFEKLTAEHSWYPETKKNIHYYNGWKTNKVHKINNKVILPVHGMFSDYSWSKETFKVYEAERVITDIEKVFDFLDGNMTACVDLHGVLESACREGRTKNISCKYFDVTLYKKGTMHIKFHNQALVDRFNIYCCQHKAWLPPSYGRKTYDEMTVEEKTVVDGFNGDGTEGSGEQTYTKVLREREYYLAEPTNKVPALLQSNM